MTSPASTSPSSPPCRVVVVGAGTGVGKTHVACALASVLVDRGFALVAKKPVESGYDEPASDAAALARAAGHSILRPLHALAAAVSPHRAARLEGVAIDLGGLVRWCDGAGATLVETAGGLLSPLSPSLTNLDLASALRPTHVVLVVGNRLGALHDVRSCQLALRERGLAATVVLSAPVSDDAATSHNAEELRTLGWASEVIEFPRRPLGAPGTKRAALALAAVLRLGG